MLNFVKSFLFSLVIVAISIFAILIIEKLDSYFGIKNFRSDISIVAGLIFLLIGVIFRIWAAWTFYQNQLRVITLTPQHTFIRSGPYKFSRNPLYVGIVSIALGSALLFGSLIGFISSVLIFLGWDVYVKRVEEKALEKKFGDSYIKYKQGVPRWLGFKKIMEDNAG